jgi:hypothetical protein
MTSWVGLHYSRLRQGYGGTSPRSSNAMPGRISFLDLLRAGSNERERHWTPACAGVTTKHRSPLTPRCVPEHLRRRPRDACLSISVVDPAMHAEASPSSTARCVPEHLRRRPRDACLSISVVDSAMRAGASPSSTPRCVPEHLRRRPRDACRSISVVDPAMHAGASPSSFPRMRESSVVNRPATTLGPRMREGDDGEPTSASHLPLPSTAV